MARLTILLLTVVSIVGCMSDPACERQIALMRAELLDLEDRYALLQAKYEGATGTCDTSQETTRPLERLLQPSSPSKSSEPPPQQPDNIQIELDPQDLSSGVRFQMPAIARLESRRETDRTLAEQADHPANSTTEVHIEPNREIQQVDFEQLDSPTDAHGLSSVLVGEPVLAELQVVAGPLSSQQAGDPADGLELLLIPRTTDGEPQWRPGDLSIAVIDPTEEEADRQRIGTWHFTWKELAGEPGQADTLPSHVPLRLPLTWNFNSPRHDRVRLFVRFAPHGAAALEAEQLVPLDQLAGSSGPDELEQRLSRLLGESASAADASSDDIRAADLPVWRPNR